jgi:hypothetical protein
LLCFAGGSVRVSPQERSETLTPCPPYDPYHHTTTTSKSDDHHQHTNTTTTSTTTPPPPHHSTAGRNYHHLDTSPSLVVVVITAVVPDCVAAERASQNLFASSTETKTVRSLICFMFHVRSGVAIDLRAVENFYSTQVLCILSCLLCAHVFSLCVLSPNVEIPRATPMVDQVPVNELRMVTCSLIRVEENDTAETEWHKLHPSGRRSLTLVGVFMYILCRQSGKKWFVCALYAKLSGI